MKSYLRQAGVAGVAFFMIKGLAWLAVLLMPLVSARCAAN